MSATEQLPAELDFFSLPKTAKILGIAKDRLRADGRAGRIRMFNVGTASRPRFKISRAAIEEYLKRREVGTQKKQACFKPKVTNPFF